MALNLFTVPPHVPFLDALAKGWLARGEDPLTVSRGLILLPTRRSARALAEAFLRAGNGRPMLMPRITALGALDETPLALTGALDLPPAVAPMQRLAVLSTLAANTTANTLSALGHAPSPADGVSALVSGFHVAFLVGAFVYLAVERPFLNLRPR